jgi:sigma-B regulation protein RsbU (phosphoserine phosphatase)
MASVFQRVESRFYLWLRRETPTAKSHRTAFWLLISYLLLQPGRFLPGTTGVVFSLLSTLDFWLLISYCIPLVWRYVFSRLLWKVQHRLVVTYLLMGLAPVLLLVTLALIATYMFSGQFATFAATAEIDKELAHLAAENRAFALHVAHSLEADPKATAISLPELTDPNRRHEQLDLHVSAYEDDKPLKIVASPQTTTEPLPSWVQDGFRGVVLDDGKLYLRAIDGQTIGSHSITVVTSLPLGRKNVDKIASGLGRVTIVPTIGGEDNEKRSEGGESKAASGSTAAQPTPAPGVHVSVGDNKSGFQVNGREARSFEVRGGSISGGELPPPSHFYDLRVEFLAPLMTSIWKTGELHDALIHVESRPSLLYQRLFIASLKIAAFIQDALISIAVLFAILELIAFIMAMRLNRTITRSVRDLYVATQEIDGGNLAHRIEVKRNDQLAALSRSFNGMTASLERLMQTQLEKERLQNELQIAQEVQANLFPRGNIMLPMLELHGVCRPARTVSGDYYDFLLFTESSLGLALGDISGKGISAALLMATLHSAVRAYRFAGEELIVAGVEAIHAGSVASVRKGVAEVDCGELFESPGKVLALLNRHLYRSTQPEKYATLFLAHYEGLTSRLTYSNGGQLPPLLLRADDSIARLDRGGTVVGLMDGMSYEEGTVQLRRGDILVAYSDGVTEPENEFGDFGEERLMELVRRHRHLPLASISDQVLLALRSWIGGEEQPDDITLVLARQR